MRPQFVQPSKRPIFPWSICAVLIVVGLFSRGLSARTEATRPAAVAPSPVGQDPFWKGRPHAAWAQPVFDLARTGAPLKEQRAALVTALLGQGISPLAVERVLSHTVDGITLLEDDGPHRSALGGEAVLPPGRAWPRNPDSGQALTFLARIDLDEVHARAPLPADGTLLVFYDEEGRSLDPYATIHVDYVPAGVEPAPAVVPPKGAWASYARSPLRAVAMPITGEIDHIVEGLPDDEADRLWDALDELSWGRFDNQLLGASRDIQGPVLDEVPYWLKESASGATRARFSESERSGSGWMLLAQITGSSATGRGGTDIAFADGGNLSLLIQRRDLDQRRFDRVLGIIQSH